VILGVSAVVVALGIVIALALAVGHGSIDVSNLGDKELWVGNADRLAKRVTKDGPFILGDVSPNKDRVVYLQHLGTNKAKGWFTIDAGTNACPLEWTGSGFRDCDGTGYPADGEGRMRYRTWVQKNGVYVDLRRTVP
jgi:hypothetical protein